MRSIVLSVAARHLLPILIVFAVFLLLRGHEEPGGGFAAALVISAAVGYGGLADDVDALKELVPAPLVVMSAGFLVALAAGAWGMLFGDVFLQGSWLPFEVPIIGGMEIGTPVLFDVGVCLVASGAVVQILVSLLEDE